MNQIDSSTDSTHSTRSNSHPIQAWDALAAAYDAHVTPRKAEHAKAAFALARLRASDRFLDVAAGTGALALPAARLGAKVVATDFSPRMIERFNARARDERLADAEGQVMDCHALAFADDTFDVTGSQFGVMLVPDQETALREMVRVTKPGGRVLVIAYGAPSAFEVLHVFLDGIRAVDPGFPGLPSNPPPLEFQVSDPEVLRARLVKAGLRDVTVDTSQVERVEVRSGRELWDWCLGSNPIPGIITAHLDDAKKEAMRKHLDDSLRARARASGRDVAELTAPLNIGIGTK
jgi:ubiquinone/menaquinone biosynthesis C-methylase UbiE